jgi:hypothetical protein
LLLVICCWLFVVGYLLFVVGCWLGKGERGTGNSYQEEETDNRCLLAVAVAAIVPVVGY